ncbi:hypothetical protein IT398_02410 [Candidatus Nomurabacteria bacterium]|nr:hypothetical protein [Candidatus Nomurabacteria bacterium]
MLKKVLVFVMLLGFLILPAILYSAPQGEFRAVTTTEVTPQKLGELILPYRGNGNLSIIVERDENGVAEGTSIAFSIPAPAGFSCKNIGWEFPLGAVPEKLLGADSITREMGLSGQAQVSVVEKKLVIEIISDKTRHVFIIPWNDGFSYDGDEYNEFTEEYGLVVLTKMDTSTPQADSAECPGGRCDCGQDRCEACCSAGYHPLCRSCQTNSQNCGCFRNRTQTTPEVAMNMEAYESDPA